LLFFIPGCIVKIQEVYVNAVLVKDVASDIGIDSECSICAQLRDPVTGNPRFNTETLTA